MIYIITPCTRIFNLDRMKQSIPAECTWVVSYDASVWKKEDGTTLNVPDAGAINIQCPLTGHYGNPARNFALDKIAPELKDDDWIYILDDDNIIHPDWYYSVKDHLADNKMIHWGQCYPDGTIRENAPERPILGTVDTAQYMVRWDVAKDIRFKEVYEADNFYADECLKAAGTSLKIDKPLGYYNYLRGNKKGDTTRVRICMITMFKNEAGHLRRMLDSVTPYIDYWVIQDNGSTDGSPEIVKQWAEETGIPGKLYQVEEGWVNFGWNRDHLLQTALKEPHGCDWIMKMDCDESLEVDRDFDWSVFWTPHQSFHVTAVGPGIIYYRAWIWNAKLRWKFNHDPAHETIMIDDGVTGENFYRHNLPKSFRMITGQSYGESYSVPTKYVTDALKLEEKLIREGTMLSDLYHFWYIGKSYEDCYRGDFFPLQGVHQNEYARRCIFYFDNIVKFKHGGYEPKEIDEMCYYALCGIGNAHRFLKEYDKAIDAYINAEAFCPRRNDHLIYLTEIHWELRDFLSMYHYASIMMEDNRTLPFPEYFFLLNTNMYKDSGTYPQYLMDIAKKNFHNVSKETILAVNKVNPRKRLFVVDNFFSSPDVVRDFALKQRYEDQSDWYKGRRTFERFHTPQIKKAFEDIMGHKITNWEEHGMNGKFQYCVPQNPLVYHYDSQAWAAMIYLTPDAPFMTGTSLYAHKETKIRHIDEHPDADKCFEGGFYDSTKFELVDTIGNVYNRLVIFDARSFHAAHQYFGTDIHNSRLFQIFFFD